MKRKFKITLAIIACLLIFIDFTASYNNDNREIQITYHGLLWVGLDYLSIQKYKSTDQPMKILTITNKLCD